MAWSSSQYWWAQGETGLGGQGPEGCCCRDEAGQEPQSCSQPNPSGTSAPYHGAPGQHIVAGCQVGCKGPCPGRGGRAPMDTAGLHVPTWVQAPPCSDSIAHGIVQGHGCALSGWQSEYLGERQCPYQHAVPLQQCAGTLPGSACAQPWEHCPLAVTTHRPCDTGDAWVLQACTLLPTLLILTPAGASREVPYFPPVWRTMFRSGIYLSGDKPCATSSVPRVPSIRASACCTKANEGWTLFWSEVGTA